MLVFEDKGSEKTNTTNQRQRVGWRRFRGYSSPWVKWIICFGFSFNILNPASLIQASAEQRPNIVLLMAEDITNHLSCYGYPGIQTPVLDRLAAEGIRFDRFYTTAPMCSTSRTSMMTGVYQTSSGGMHHRSRVIPPSYVRPVTHLLREVGYETVLGSDWIEPTGTKIDVNFKGWDAAYLFDHVETLGQVIEEHPDKPFFAQIQLAITHRWFDKEWPIIRDRSVDPVDPNAIFIPPYFPDDKVVRADESLRLDIIEYMDSQVGILVEKLRQAGVLENTVIIFIGDNGLNQVRGKSYLYETGILCPLIVWSKQPLSERSVREDLLSGVDLTATILNLAGVEPQNWMQGRAFLKNEHYQPRSYVVCARDRHDEIGECMRSIRKGRYKYIRNFMPEVPYDSRMNYYENHRPILPHMRNLHRLGELSQIQSLFFAANKPEEELYDLEIDPHELYNLAKDLAFHEQLTELRELLYDWIEESEDMALVSDGDGDFCPTKLWKGTVSKPWMSIRDQEVDIVE